MDIIATDKKPLLVSTMTGKLAGLAALSFDTLSNDYCSKMRQTDAICSKCYSAAMLQGVRKNCRPAWANNQELLSARVLSDAELLEIIRGARGASLLTDYLRISAHGEIVNFTMLVNLMRLAALLPSTKFVWWTKRKELLSRYLREGLEVPSNVKLIYSNPVVDRVKRTPPKGFSAVFNVVSKNSKETVNCFKKCRECMLCYSGDEKVIVERIK